MAEDLADEGSLAIPLHAALLRDAAHLQLIAVLQARHPPRVAARTGRVAGLRRQVAPAPRAAAAGCTRAGTRERPVAVNAASPLGGCAVACFSVRCIRSCRPLSCGEAGRLRSGTMPSFTNHIDNALSPPGATDANGTPVVGVDHPPVKPNSRNAVSNTARANSVIGSRHNLAAQQIPAAGIGDGQRVHSRAVAGPEPPP